MRVCACLRQLEQTSFLVISFPFQEYCLRAKIGRGQQLGRPTFQYCEETKVH